MPDEHRRRKATRAEGTMDFKDIQEIYKIIQGTDIEEVEFTKEGETVRIKRVLTPSPVRGEAAGGPAGEPTGPAQPSAAQIPPPEEEKKVSVNSPFVGTFYRSASPGSPPLVDVGTRVKKGQPLCIVEAMKLMNEIEAEVNGTVVGILKEDGKPVEFGEPLFIIEPAEG